MTLVVLHTPIDANRVLRGAWVLTAADRAASATSYATVQVGVTDGNGVDYAGAYTGNTQSLLAGSPLRVTGPSPLSVRLQPKQTVVADVEVDGTASLLGLSVQVWIGHALTMRSYEQADDAVVDFLKNTASGDQVFTIPLYDPPESAIFKTYTLASDVSTAADTAPVDVTGLVFDFDAESRYIIEVFGTVSAAANTTGCGLQINTSVAVTLVTMQFFHQLADTGTLTGGSSIADDASTGVSSGIPTNGTIVPFYACGTLISTTGSGTAQLRFRSETTAVTTIKANTIMRVQGL